LIIFNILIVLNIRGATLKVKYMFISMNILRW